VSYARPGSNPGFGTTQKTGDRAAAMFAWSSLFLPFSMIFPRTGGKLCLLTMKNSPTDGEYCPIRAGFFRRAKGESRFLDYLIVLSFQVFISCICFSHHCGTRLAL
jgi:hypothetical protein